MPYLENTDKFYIKPTTLGIFTQILLKAILIKSSRKFTTKQRTIQKVIVTFQFFVLTFLKTTVNSLG